MSTSPSQLANLTIESGGRNSTGSSDDDDGGTLGLYGFSIRGSGDDADGSTSTADSLPVVVDCSDIPGVLSVMATAFAGEYGAGQRIYFQVRQPSRRKRSLVISDTVCLLRDTKRRVLDTHHDQ